MGQMKIEIISWGKKLGRTPAGFTAIDCTPLRNPHFEAGLADLDGRDPRIAAFVKRDLNEPVYAWQGIQDYAWQLVKKGKTKLAFVCVGGKHRSVAAAEAFFVDAKDQEYDVDIKHMALEGTK